MTHVEDFISDSSFLSSFHRWCKFLLQFLIQINFLFKFLLFRFGVIVAFVTNITLQHGVENSTLSARHAVEDSQTYLKSTSYHIRHLLVNNYGELKEHLFYTLDKTAETVIKQLDHASNSISLEQLNNIVKALPEVQENMVEMNKITKDMQAKANQLNDGEIVTKKKKVHDFYMSHFLFPFSMKFKLFEMLNVIC